MSEAQPGGWWKWLCPSSQQSLGCIQSPASTFEVSSAEDPQHPQGSGTLVLWEKAVRLKWLILAQLYECLQTALNPVGKRPRSWNQAVNGGGMRNCEWKLKVKRFREKVRRPFPPWDSWAGGCIAQGNCAGSILGVFWSTKGHSSKHPDVGPEATLSKQKDALETSSLAFPYKYPYDLEILYK